jgi:hypothetical protein
MHIINPLIPMVPAKPAVGNRHLFRVMVRDKFPEAKARPDL